ncbi:hypothetical protein FDP41_012837 [Naegleria fowleri]|uniref:Uncharacterized protein n=1 Tax=Naegleria fowleri TaxID=5763 RepID=A0A6A5C6X3_NAEFO|nr:uncharacterized protein FDP41_012837 [Naegleria fowleri]KAF0981049.1 hypothetical protein FDP41_012837 [Naegleria fowleri]CAG4709034.1 unnamed protein product [Naegleria fowleri]
MFGLFNQVQRKILYYLLSLFFGGNKSYQFRPGDSVLVIEVGKDYVKYFKLTKPTTQQQSSLSTPSHKYLEQDSRSGTYLNMKSLLPPQHEKSSTSLRMIEN